MRHPPSVFDYTDYRAYLADVFAHRKVTEPGFSLRAFARSPHMKLSSSSFLSALLKGRKNLSQPLRLRFGRALALDRKEQERFDCLVQHNQSRTAQERAYFSARLSSRGLSRAKILEEERLELFRKWPYRIIWSYLASHPDQKNPAHIGKALIPGLASAEVAEAIEVLLRLKLIKRLANGFAATEGHVATDSRFRGATAMAHTRAYLDAAKEALESQPAAERFFDILSFPVSEKGFALIRDRLAALRDEVRDLSEKERGGGLMALGMQLFRCGRLGESHKTAVSTGFAASAAASVESGNPESP